MVHYVHAIKYYKTAQEGTDLNRKVMTQKAR
jgi:hypothetical protein